jgi:peptidoglycan-associated lipoprotein
MLNVKPLLIVIIMSLPLAACGKKPVETLPPAPGGDQSAQATQAAGPIGLVPGSQADFQQQMSGRDVIFFDTDQSNIDSIDAQALQTQARWLAQFPSKRVTIEGHADERGTREYNLALGERRADATRNYLISLGVSPARLSVVSYGKERPAQLGSDEQSWAQNRRAVSVIID